MRKIMTLLCALLSLSAAATTLIRPSKQAHYFVFPIQENAPTIRVRVVYENREVDHFNIMLARTGVDYTVPYDISRYDVRNLLFIVDSDSKMLTDNTTDEFDMSNTEMYRPAYHHTPSYGWMNDPNGMYYDPATKLWHLYYQCNPYGSKWENMTWGHSTSADLIHWEHQPMAIRPDGLGTIFSGSAVIDHDNTAGFGRDAVIAMYTSAGEAQTQSIAYSTDGGITFTPYAGNPVLRADIPDFRDPKIFRNEQTGEWNVALAAGQEVRYYASRNLKDWRYLSSFGKGYGSHGGVWECPDMIELPVRGTDKTKWVLLLNINPGGPFGGSATQYFVGDWDGQTFRCDHRGARWMDYGKDHYATVSFAGAPDNRHVVIAWMSNWLYANDVPTMQYRSANSLPREIDLYEDKNGELRIGVRPAKEVMKLGKRFTLKPKKGKTATIEISNNSGEVATLTYDKHHQTLTFDRTESGQTAFSKHFPGKVKMPIFPRKGDNMDQVTIDVFVDNCSVEIFDADGRFALTNLIFPNEPMCNYHVE
ncbi:MAG: GH32 C-terminal domain-containing protein [Paludibacteraceae bacterium]|nr:GH32 C-terminal domain-containing protein [Paludibacteraceae bacterium]